MLDAITYLSLLIFAGPIAGLHSRHFPTREASTSQLRTSPLAWPAVLHTARTSTCPEQQWRAVAALPVLPSRLAMLMEWAKRGDVDGLATWVLAHPEDLTLLFAEFDRRKLTNYYNAEAWARACPYLTKTLHGDVKKVIEAARATLNVTAQVKYAW